MATPLRHLAAIRARLLSSPDLVPLLGTYSSGEKAVHLANIFHIQEPVYPLITITEVGGERAVWAPRLLNPVAVQLDFFAKGDAGLMTAAQMYDYAVDLLHTDKTRTSSLGACFHEIREVWSHAMPFWDDDTNAWHAAARYLVRVSTH